MRPQLENIAAILGLTGLVGMILNLVPQPVCLIMVAPALCILGLREVRR